MVQTLCLLQVINMSPEEGHDVRNTCRAQVYEIIKPKYQIQNYLRPNSF